jgi:hypothetical protein
MGSPVNRTVHWAIDKARNDYPVQPWLTASDVFKSQIGPRCRLERHSSIIPTVRIFERERSLANQLPHTRKLRNLSTSLATMDPRLVHQTMMTITVEQRPWTIQCHSPQSRTRWLIHGPTTIPPRFQSHRGATAHQHANPP